MITWMEINKRKSLKFFYQKNGNKIILAHFLTINNLYHLLAPFPPHL